MIPIPRTLLLLTLLTTSLYAQQPERKFITFDKTVDLRRPGQYPWTEGLTLIDALLAAGGTGTFANSFWIIRGNKRLGPFKETVMLRDKNPLRNCFPATRADPRRSLRRRLCADR